MNSSMAKISINGMRLLAFPKTMISHCLFFGVVSTTSKGIEYLVIYLSRFYGCLYIFWYLEFNDHVCCDMPFVEIFQCNYLMLLTVTMHSFWNYFSSEQNIFVSYWCEYSLIFLGRAYLDGSYWRTRCVIDKVICQLGPLIVVFCFIAVLWLIDWVITMVQGPLLLTWFNFNPSMDK